MAYTKYSLTPANNNAAPPDGAPEGMLPSAVNDTMRDMMSQIRDVGDGIRGGTYTMTAPVITGGSITGLSALAITGVSTFSAGTVSAPAITTTGDTNTGIFFPAADTIAFSEGGVEAMRIDSSGNLGIGTSSPLGRLDVNGTSTVAFVRTTDTTSPTLALFVNGGSNGVGTISVDNGGIMTFDTGSTGAGQAERMRIDSSGNVGIGTSSPTAGSKLDVNGQVLAQNGTTSSLGYAFRSATNSGMYINDDGVGSNLVLQANGSNNQLYLQRTGNVGIGTSSPSAKLEVAASGTGELRVTGSSNGFQVYTDSSATTLGTYTNIPLVFRTNTTERMRIDSSGNLLVGTTSGSYGSLSGRTTVSASSGGAGLFYTNYSGDLSISALNVGKFDNNATTSQVLIRFAYNNAGLGLGQINGNGAGAAAFGGFSDRRLKENIADLPSQLANILELRPVEFDYIASEGGGHQIGFIAQEIQEVYPDVVGERSPDNMLTVTGWSKTEARLVKAIQELNDKVEAQALEIKQLKGTA